MHLLRHNSWENFTKPVGHGKGEDVFYILKEKMNKQHCGKTFKALSDYITVYFHAFITRCIYPSDILSRG